MHFLEKSQAILEHFCQTNAFLQSSPAFIPKQKDKIIETASSDELQELNDSEIL
jgi:hypothetical protein